jgi:hypothetical protein
MRPVLRLAGTATGTPQSLVAPDSDAWIIRRGGSDEATGGLAARVEYPLSLRRKYMAHLKGATMDLRGMQGFLGKPKLAANQKTYPGRFVCRSVQWTGAPPDIFGTFTITAQELADAAATRLLWTDQDVQRGIRSEVFPKPPRELSLSEGYPDVTKYVFDAANADDMVDKLLRGEQLFLNPLVWNLRPGAYEAYWNDDDGDLYLYEGRVYLPDSHHRQQGIAKAVSIWRDAPKQYPRFSGARQFKVELSREKTRATTFSQE